jgi:uncharacterized protein (TIGR03435 family)
MARLALGFLTVALMASAQITEPPAFEVATVRRSPPPEGDNININVGTVRNGKVTFANASLSDCLKFAYGIVSDDQIAGPDWIKSKAVRFDIVAQAPVDTPREQLALMLQPLLRERLKLEMHHEPRTMPFLALVVGRSGPKLAASTKENDVGKLNSTSGGRIGSNRMSMQLLATLISRFERRTVVDMTGLEGNFEVHLEWTPDSPSTAVSPDAVSPDAPRGPSIFTAVQEQLGLKLESRKEPLDVLVVDHSEQVPTEN